MIVSILIALFIIGIVQSIGLIIRYIYLKDTSVAYGKGILSYFYTYIAFFIVLGLIFHLKINTTSFPGPDLLFIMIVGPVMAIRYLYVTQCLAKEHEEYV